MSAAANDHATGHSGGDGPFARLGRDFDNFVQSCVPSEEVTQHFANARIEVLKGLRAMIDSRIERLSADRKKGVSIPVE
jgi:hypothetical protein